MANMSMYRVKYRKTDEGTLWFWAKNKEDAIKRLNVAVKDGEAPQGFDCEEADLGDYQFLGGLEFVRKKDLPKEFAEVLI